KKIFFGKTSELFAPEDNLTRAEFAVLISRSLELETKAYEGKFNDVSANMAWAFPGIEAAARAGIIFGQTDGGFNPNAEITREELATIIIRAIKYDNASLLNGLPTPAQFKDASSISTFAKDSVAQAVALEVVFGKRNNTFEPQAKATRAEAAVMLHRALKKLGEL
ncbi:MAG: S-layer homology domain-containing protein, partial [Psychrobacillus psychrotolerans]